jgi:hypothetical protein
MIERPIYSSTVESLSAPETIAEPVFRADPVVTLVSAESISAGVTADEVITGTCRDDVGSWASEQTVVAGAAPA